MEKQASSTSLVPVKLGLGAVTVIPLLFQSRKMCLATLIQGVMRIMSGPMWHRILCAVLNTVLPVLVREILARSLIYIHFIRSA